MLNGGLEVAFVRLSELDLIVAGSLIKAGVALNFELSCVELFSNVVCGVSRLADLFSSIRSVSQTSNALGISIFIDLADGVD